MRGINNKQKGKTQNLEENNISCKIIQKKKTQKNAAAAFQLWKMIEYSGEWDSLEAVTLSMRLQ